MPNEPTEERSTEDKHQDQKRLEPKHRRAVKVGWSIYQQIAAVFAPFGLAALLGHFWEIGWRGFLEIIVGV